MPLVEVQPRADITPGTYEAAVSSVEKDIITPRSGRNAGQNVPILRWKWAVDGIDEPIESITSRDPSSEKSNLFKYFVAMLGTDKKAWMDAEVEDLVGRKALITISLTDEGWPRVDNVTGMPVRRGPAAAPTPAGEPVNPQPVQTAFSEGKLGEEEALPDDLPF
jgi:hypothetical protein